MARGCEEPAPGSGPSRRGSQTVSVTPGCSLPCALPHHPTHTCCQQNPAPVLRPRGLQPKSLYCKDLGHEAPPPRLHKEAEPRTTQRPARLGHPDGLQSSLTPTPAPGLLDHPPEWRQAGPRTHLYTLWVSLQVEPPPPTSRHSPPEPRRSAGPTRTAEVLMDASLQRGWEPLAGRTKGASPVTAEPGMKPVLRQESVSETRAPRGVC